jgi:hypothetical protein
MKQATKSPNKVTVMCALGWYQKAALNGNSSAQRHLGLGLLTSLPHRNSTTMDAADLLIVQEAIQWLQAAAINGNSDAFEDLLRLFRISSTEPNIQNRLYRGVSGNDEIDRIKNMFPHGHNFIEVATALYAEFEADETKRAKIQAAFLDPRRQPLIKPICQGIENTKPKLLGKNEAFPEDLANMVAQYVVG